MIRDDWSGLVGAGRWWHLDGGMILFGILRRWSKNWLHIDLPDGNLRLRMRPIDIIKLTIPDGGAWAPPSRCVYLENGDRVYE